VVEFKVMNAIAESGICRDSFLQVARLVRRPYLQLVVFHRDRVAITLAARAGASMCFGELVLVMTRVTHSGAFIPQAVGFEFITFDVSKPKLVSIINAR
jgi:hypothetical protein